MKIKNYYITLTVASVIFLLITAFSSNPQTLRGNKTNKDVIKFSHKIHSSIDCENCHVNVVESTKLTDRLLPIKDNCASCHDVNDSETCNTCHYEGVYEPLIFEKSQLIFNHKLHIESGQKCDNCHKGLAEVDYSFQSVSYNPDMASCYTCHNDINQTNACEACHISTANLIPQDHKKSNFINLHKFTAQRTDANCIMCHDNNSCEECHAGTKMLTEKNKANDFYQPYAPSNFTDGIKQQNINRVHDLNYRFTHGIELKGKNSQCQTCHEIETFCVNCHNQSGGDISLGGVMPASHLKPDFVKFPGTDGGEHAKIARRDIERCISCHDVQGEDPSCINCHIEKR